MLHLIMKWMHCSTNFIHFSLFIQWILCMCDTIIVRLQVTWKRACSTNMPSQFFSILMKVQQAQNAICQLRDERRGSSNVLRNKICFFCSIVIHTQNSSFRCTALQTGTITFYSLLINFFVWLSEENFMQKLGIAFALFLGYNVDDSYSNIFNTLFGINASSWVWIKKWSSFSPPLSIDVGNFFFISTLLLTFFHF